MSLADAIREQAEPRRVWGGCTVGEWLEELPDEERDGMVELLGEPQRSPNYVPSTQIARLLKDQGVDIAHSTFARHRRGDCACD